MYTEFESEAEQTIVPAVPTNETPTKSREEFNGSPETPDFSNLPSTLQSTPAMPAIAESGAKYTISEATSSSRIPLRKRKEKRSVTLGLYETIPPEPILLPSRDDYLVKLPPKTNDTRISTGRRLLKHIDKIEHFPLRLIR